MSASRKRKFELVLPRVEALAALTDLTAQAAEGNLVIDGEVFPLEDFTSLKIAIKHLGASSLLKVSLKYPALGLAALPTPAGVDADDAAREAAMAGVPETVEPGGKPKYKGLKKRMKQYFKAIVTALRAGLVPDADSMAAFIADSRLMTSYPGKGDAFYPAYDAEVDRLEAAAAAGDLEAMTASVAALDRMKKECHSRHA
ncbi:GAK system XXXCH domain-containing protein [Desulfovibrio sp. JY]|nr:GAK system XXXCH domain-containing protein [Desulfovibrio sp. JY]